MEEYALENMTSTYPFCFGGYIILISPLIITVTIPSGWHRHIPPTELDAWSHDTVKPIILSSFDTLDDTQRHNTPVILSCDHPQWMNM